GSSWELAPDAADAAAFPRARPAPPAPRSHRATAGAFARPEARREERGRAVASECRRVARPRDLRGRAGGYRQTSAILESVPIQQDMGDVVQHHPDEYRGGVMNPPLLLYLRHQVRRGDIDRHAGAQGQAVRLQRL